MLYGLNFHDKLKKITMDADYLSPADSQEVRPAQKLHRALARGNREVVTDYYVEKEVDNESLGYAFKIFIRLNAKKQKFRKVSFQHSIFDTCYFNHCVFESCDFTGCRFVGCNLHQSAFSGCNFEYATFERTQVDDDILDREAPSQENLKMRFARTLRMNFQQIGDAKAVNKAISLELNATASYLRKSWSSKESYYQKKYSGWKKVPQFLKWAEFKLLDFIWGNGESTLSLLRTIAIIHLIIAVYDATQFGSSWNLNDYLSSLKASPGVFFGISFPHQYPIWVVSLIAASRLIGFAFLTAILVKRFGRR